MAAFINIFILVTFCSTFIIFLLTFYNINSPTSENHQLPPTLGTNALNKFHPTIGGAIPRKVLPRTLFPDPSLLGNIPNFAYVLNRDICSEDHVDMLILVGSHPQHSRMRKVLRKAWGTPRMDQYVIRMVFLFGRPDDALLQQQMLDESTEFGDLVQGNFRDDYRNITFRDLMGLRWAWSYCRQARFVTRTDDDVIMSLDHVIDALEEQMPTDGDYVACYVHYVGTPVLRDGRYELSRKEHPNDVYDHYCQGWTYWLTTGAAKKMDKMALKVTPYWVNDAYITGTLMTALGWEHLTLNINSTNDNMEFVRYLTTAVDTKPQFVHGYNGEDTNLTELVQDRLRSYCHKNHIPRHKPPKFKPQ